MANDNPTYISIPDEPVLDDKIDKYSRFYAYGRDGYHSGGQYIVKECAERSRQYISLGRVRAAVEIAKVTGQQIRITNGDDFLTYWLVDGNVKHPANEEEFWKRMEQKVPTRL